MLEIKDLSVSIGNKRVIDNLFLSFGKGLYFLMGPNGVGKSTLVRAIAGDQSLNVSGKIIIDGIDVTSMPPEERFMKGLFTGFQIPPEIKGIHVNELLARVSSKFGVRVDFKSLLPLVGLSDEMMVRDVNVGFSGGEMKKLEMLQMLAFSPRYAVLDEPDSGVDLDTSKVMGQVLLNESRKRGILVITHTGNLARIARPDKVFVMVNGKIVKSGDMEVISNIETNGYSVVK